MAAYVFAEDGRWGDLARARGVRLPHHETALTTGQMERWLRRLGVSTAQYFQWTGERKLRDFKAQNPAWTLRAWVGLVLEYLGPPSDGAQEGTSKARGRRKPAGQPELALRPMG